MNRSQKQKYKWAINTQDMFNTFSSPDKDGSERPEIPLHPSELIFTNKQKLPVTKAGPFWGVGGIPPHCCWVCKRGQPQWKTTRGFFQSPQTESCCGAAHPS